MTGRPSLAMRSTLPALLVALTGAVASADEPKVEVVADVVLMSNNGTYVDPTLLKMKDTFSKEGFSFSSYKRISTEHVTLQQRKPTEVKVPNGQTAHLQLESLRQGTATISVSVGAISTTYTLGREGSVFINFGNQNGELMLVLSPVTAKKAG